jgi:thioredoxin-dependent peroxiredoxin
MFLASDERTLQMPLPTLGQSAPPFTLPDQDGIPHMLKNYAGRWVLVYFYPKAMTPGCTTQACVLRDGAKELAAHNVTVLGISPDKPSLLKKFIEKEQLNFTLLSDIEHKMADAYGAWQEKSMYGRTYMGMARMSVLINPAGVVQMVWPKVAPANQLDDLLLWFKNNKE